MDPELWELIEEGDSEDEVAAIARLNQPGDVPQGVRIVAQLGDIFTIRMKRGDIQRVRAEEAVTSLKAPGFGLAPDIEIESTELLSEFAELLPSGNDRRPPSVPETGCGMVVGIVDWGFDFAHPDFCHEDGSTRILRMWDQRPLLSSKSPQPYGYGVVRTSEDIDRALAASDPYEALGYHPADADTGRGSHGTLVASIAAGNGRSGGPVGVAPEADLVLVHLSAWGSNGGGKLGDSVTLLEAVHFIAQTAGKRPWVINLSMGRHGEQHDASLPVVQGLDALLRSAPGGCVVQSCGNYFERRIHASGKLRPAEERILIWDVTDGDVTPNELEVWYAGRDIFDVEIRSHDGAIFARAALGEQASLTADGRKVGALYNRAYEPNTFDNHVEIILYPGAPPGSWELTLIGKDVTDGRFHCWIERDPICPPCQSRFRAEDAISAFTTGTICNGLRTIAVGAYNHRSPERELARFSSSGPTRDGRTKPDLVAPGVSVFGARSAPRNPQPDTPPVTSMSGTSFAAPHVTGAIALMFEAAGRPLRIEETHNLLLANAEHATGSQEFLNRVGSGYLDIAKAVEAARNVGSGGPEFQPYLYRKAEEGAVRGDAIVPMTESRSRHHRQFLENVAEDSIAGGGNSKSIGSPRATALSGRLEQEATKRDDRFAASPVFPFQVQVPIGGGAPALALPVGGSGTPLAITVPLGGATPAAPAPVVGQSGGIVPTQLAAPEPATEPPPEPVPEIGEVAEQEARGVDLAQEQTFRRLPALEGDAGFVELADRAVAELTAARTPREVVGPLEPLRQIFSRAGAVESLCFPGSGRLLSAAELFDAFAFPGREALRERLEEVFDLVALPRAPLDGKQRAGDLLLRRGEGGLGHLSILGSLALRNYEELVSEGLTPEEIGHGRYVQVIETGVRPHTLSDAFARRVADDDGRLLHNQLVLRLREHVRPRRYESAQEASWEQAGGAPFSVGGLVPARRFVDMPLTYEDFITNATGSGRVIKRTRCETLAHVAAATIEVGSGIHVPRRMPLPPVTIGGTTFDPLINHTDLIRSMSTTTPPLLWRVTPGDRLQAALDLVIFFPADPADLTRLLPGSARFPLAIVVHGNHPACERTPTPGSPPCRPTASGAPGVTAPPVSPGGNRVGLFTSATFGPEVPSHMGYSGATPTGPAWSNLAGINAGPAVTPYLQEELAKHGIISVSVSTNAANFFGLHLETRADLILKAVAEVRRLNSERSSPFFHRVDFEKLAFVGHSRGGDAIIRAALKQPSLNVRALVQIAPTDITGLTSGAPPNGEGGARIDFVTSPMRVSSDLDAFHLIIYGSRDGDVSGFEDVRVGESVHPFRHYDRSSAQRAFFFWHGATHNRFNRFWSDDDECRLNNLIDLAHPAGLLDRTDQEARTRELVGACLRFVLNGETAQRDLLNGRSLSTIAPSRPMAAMWKLGRALKSIDNFDDPRSDRNTLGGRNLPPASGLVDEIRLANENPPGAGVTAFQFMHIDRVLRAAFTSTPVPGVGPAPGGATLPAATPSAATLSGRWRAEVPPSDQNFSSFMLITLRVTKKWDPAAIMAANSPIVKVRLLDSGGHAHEELAAPRISALPETRRITFPSTRPACIPSSSPWPPHGWPPTVDLTKFHFDTWEVELSHYALAPGIDLHHIAAVEIESVGLAGQPVYVDTISLVRL